MNNFDVNLFSINENETKKHWQSELSNVCKKAHVGQMKKLQFSKNYIILSFISIIVFLLWHKLHVKTL